MEKEQTLLLFEEVVAQVGFAPRTLRSRIDAAGVTVYIDGVDRRRRMIDARDLPKLMNPRPVKRSDRKVAA